MSLLLLFSGATSVPPSPPTPPTPPTPPPPPSPPSPPPPPGSIGSLRPRRFGAFNPAPRLTFANVEPGETLDYPIELARLPLPGARVLRDLINQGDAPRSAAVQISPSGTGELTCTALTLAGLVLTPWFTAGVAGREYVLQITLTMTSGRIIVFAAVVPVAADFALAPPPEPPTWDFGPETTCMAPSLATSVTPAAALLLATVPCTVRFVHGVATTVPGWLLLLDANAIPTAGATVNPDLAWPLAANAPPFDFFPGIAMQTGAVLLFSVATAPNLYTPSSTALLAGETL
ncbi:MAG TPA: hypothetical protein VK741_25640 [Acetobacteraceae bacterium]|nr:hypothetical protein [Acetobacteraceae bacterium]